MDWFLYDNGLCLERINKASIKYLACCKSFVNFQKPQLNFWVLNSILKNPCFRSSFLTGEFKAAGQQVENEFL